MVIDCFLFYNELDLLEIRLNVLKDVVDTFVLVECPHTFTGKEKPLYFQENKDRFKDFNIVHHVVTEYDLDNARKSPNVGNGEHWWAREFAQKEAMLDALNFCSDDDIVFISDLDEIWNPNMQIYTDDNVYRPIQTAYHYYLNNRSNQNINGWVGTRYGKYKTLKKYGINHFRTEREAQSVQVPNGGWHFTFMGGAESIKNKIESYSHQEYNTPSTMDMVELHIKNNTDFLNRGFSLWKDESELPRYILDNKEKYKHLFL